MIFVILTIGLIALFAILAILSKNDNKPGIKITTQYLKESGWSYIKIIHGESSALYIKSYPNGAIFLRTYGDNGVTLEVRGMADKNFHSTEQKTLCLPLIKTVPQLEYKISILECECELAPIKATGFRTAEEDVITFAFLKGLGFATYGKSELELYKLYDAGKILLDFTDSGDFTISYTGPMPAGTQDYPIRVTTKNELIQALRWFESKLNLTPLSRL